jgi:TolB protein
MTRVTNDPAFDDRPWWSPDSKQFVFGSSRGGSMQLYVMNADGRALRQLTRQPGSSGRPSWSPDGTRIVYECRPAR